jgi:hypothetical protein
MRVVSVRRSCVVCVEIVRELWRRTLATYPGDVPWHGDFDGGTDVVPVEGRG